LTFVRAQRQTSRRENERDRSGKGVGITGHTRTILRSPHSAIAEHLLFHFN